ncbi:atrial natriuretic peptide receptor 1-like [Gigantopelta aegis]|uniref:atrial natriuretic peptide receptor 1-like n=1 Tax=Gigantopelta aegis TaxID=1735272 RepID=UPI001B88D31C|nr:atrial natriuretic peptide receptor 1-like [Gigantopelta aegis]
MTSVTQFGSPSAMVPVADLAAYYNVPIFSWETRQHIVDNKTKYSTLVRSRPPISSLVEMFYEISFRFNWKLAAIVYTGDTTSTRAVAQSMIAKFVQDRHFNLVKEFVMSQNAPSEEIHPVMQAIKRLARIIFIIIPQRELRRYMLMFHVYGMTNGDYQFLFTELDVTSRKVLQNGHLWRGNDGRDEAARKAFNNVLIFTFMDILNERPSMQLGQTAYDEIFQNSTLPRPLEVNAFQQSFESSHLSQVSVLLKDGLAGTVFMNNVSDRSPGFVVWDLGLDGNFEIALTLAYIPINTSSGITAIREVHMYINIIWGDGRTSDEYIPLDRPECGFFSELCNDNTRTILLATIISGALLIVFVGGLCFMRWWRREREVSQMAWKINYSELDFHFQQTKNKSMSNFTSVLNVFGSHESSIGSGSALSSYGSTMGCSAFLSRNVNLALYKNSIVVVKNIRKSKIKLDREMMLHMRELYYIRHVNLATFIGMCTEIDKVAVAWGFCAKGSLQDIVDNASMKLDGAFQFSIAIDICMGLVYLHAGTLKLHGNLKSTNCVIDNHWVCKLTDYGMRPIRHGESEKTDVNEDELYSDLFWMAPELLREHLLSSTFVPTQCGDIFALGVILKELLCLSKAYTNDLTPKDLLDRRPG